MFEETTFPLQPILPIPVAKQEELCRLIANGEMDEEEACHQVAIGLTDFSFMKFQSPEFVDRLDQAYKKRADHWHKKVMKSADDIPDKEFASGAKLQFEKLKWLAEIDNPDKYGKKSSTTVDINHNIHLSMKKMTTAEALKILQEDPFAIPAECTVIEEEQPKKKRPPL